MSARTAEDAKRPLDDVQPGRVLVVDDDDDTRWLVMETLTRGKLACVEAASGEQALAVIDSDPNAIDVVVMDVSMPGGMDGVEVLRSLKRSVETAHIPIIMVTASATLESDIVYGVESGASDYLPKPCSPAVLLAKVRALRTHAQAERKMRHDLRFASLHAMTDPLTGLFNRRNFETRLAEASAYAKRHEQAFAVIMLDIDHFKKVNDTHGHAEGDRVLVQFAADIRAVLRADDVAFRYGGEEFVLLLRACDATRAEDVARRLRTRLRANPYHFADGTEQIITFSAGAAAAQASEGFAGEQLVSRSDAALYVSKNGGRDRVKSWYPTANDAA